jgi:hypothetical protein
MLAERAQYLEDFSNAMTRAAEKVPDEQLQRQVSEIAGFFRYAMGAMYRIHAGHQEQIRNGNAELSDDMRADFDITVKIIRIAVAVLHGEHNPSLVNDQHSECVDLVAKLRTTKWG